MVERKATMMDMMLLPHPIVQVWVVWVDMWGRQVLIAFKEPLTNPYILLQKGKLYKQRVTFKHARDGFLIDAVFEDGYAIKLSTGNAPPKKWVQKGYSPTHSQIILCQMPCPINITIEEWTILSFQRSSCGQCMKKQSLKQWFTEFYDKKVVDYPTFLRRRLQKR